MKLYDIKYKAPNIGYFPLLDGKVNHGFSWGKGAGNMQFSLGDQVETRANLTRFLDTLDMGSIRESVNLMTEQGTNIADVDETLLSSLNPHRFGRSVQCDAAFTQIPNVTLTVKPADCTTAVVYAKDSKNIDIVGLIHSGWRSVVARLPEKTIEHLAKKYGCTPQSIYMGIAPHYFKESKKHHHIDDYGDVSCWGDFYEEIDGNHYFDEAGLAVSQYKEAGIPEGNIQIYEVDTIEAARTGEGFSHHYEWRNEQEGKDVEKGRFVIAVRKNSVKL